MPACERQGGSHILRTRGGNQRNILLDASFRRSLHGEFIGVVCVGQAIAELIQHSRESDRIADDLSELAEWPACRPSACKESYITRVEWLGGEAHSGFETEDELGS